MKIVSIETFRLKKLMFDKDYQEKDKIKRQQLLEKYEKWLLESRINEKDKNE